MKNYRTLMLSAFVLALVPFFFSFKSDFLKREYGTIQFIETQRKDAIIINLSGELKKISTEQFGDEKKLLEVINTFSQAGWTICSTDCVSTGAYTKRVIYLERLK